MPPLISAHVDDRSGPDGGRTQVVSSVLDPLGVVDGLLVWRLQVQMRWRLERKHVSPGCPTIQDTQRSVRSPSTVSATGRVGLGVAIVFVDELFRVHIKPGHMMTASSAEIGFLRVAWIIVF